MKRTIIAGIAGTVVAAGLGFAAPAQAEPEYCSYFGQGDGQYDRTSCGVPDLASSVENARANLAKNLNALNPKNAMDQVRKNLSFGGADSGGAASGAADSSGPDSP
jgi:hypothetical protein